MTRPTDRDDEMLTPKEARWLAEYMVTSSIKKASEAAGYKSPMNLLKREHVANALGRRLEDIMTKKAITADRVIDELGKIAFANIDDFVDADYVIQEKPKRRKMAAVQAVTITPTEDGDKVALKMYDKLGALNALGRHFGLFKDRIEISGDLTERLERATQRLYADGTLEPNTTEEE